MVALLARLYYRRAKVGQDGIVRLVNWGLDLCLALGWNKGFRTYMGRRAEVQSARGPSLSTRIRVIKEAGEDDKEIYGNGIWNTVFDLWENREIPGRNGVRRIRKLRSADDRAIREVIGYYGPRQGLFRFLASREGIVEEDSEEIDRIQKRIRISFNQQVAIARVALEEMEQ